MRSPLALRIAARALPIFLLGCGRSAVAPGLDAGRATGSGGSIVATGGKPITTTPSATGGIESGGTPGGGGADGKGGQSGSGGATSTGGATASSSGGVGSGGRSSTGGTTATPTGGVATTGGGAGSGGAAGTGGVVGTGGTSATGTGGVVGTGGEASTGGEPGTGGSTGTTFPARFVGNIDTRGSIPSNFSTYWDQFTPENAGKWPSVQAGSSATFNWSVLDTMYKHCDDRGILFKEYCFVWGAGQPSWLGSLDTTTGPAAVKNWMKSFCDRYPKTRLIDVVNEPPPHTTPTYANAIGGGTNTTWDWIANAFKWAREACPNAILILNDYNNIEYATDNSHTIDIVNAIKKLGAPIDAIGCQTHGADKLPASTLRANIDNLTKATGLPVYISEYDIGLGDDDQQKQQYQDHITMFWDHAAVKGITVWGYVVDATWRSNTGIMKSDGTMRPAMTWLMDFLGR